MAIACVFMEIKGETIVMSKTFRREKQYPDSDNYDDYDFNSMKKRRSKNKFRRASKEVNLSLDSYDSYDKYNDKRKKDSAHNR